MKICIVSRRKSDLKQDAAGWRVYAFFLSWSETVKGDHYKAFGATPKDYMASYKRLSRSDVVTGFRRREGM